MSTSQTDEEDTPSTPWAWLRGFAWLLIAWPLLSLLAADEMWGEDWDVILAATIGPAVVGLILLGVERLLTRTLGKAAAARGQPVPSLARDLSNLGFCFAILLGVDVTLVGLFEENSLFAGDSVAGPIAGIILGVSLAGGLLFRGLNRWVYGPARHVDLGEGWGQPPMTLRFLGYLTLIPVLLVCTVMIDYAMRAKPDFGPVAWVCLPALLWLGQRSAMSRAPRLWARSAWEAELRRISLYLPWWVAGWALLVGFGVLMLGIPPGWVDPEGLETLAAKIAAWIILTPLGLLCAGGGLYFAYLKAPALLGRIRFLWSLQRNPDQLGEWALEQDGEEVMLRVHLKDGRSALFEPEENGPLLKWLEG